MSVANTNLCLFAFISRLFANHLGHRRLDIRIFELVAGGDRSLGLYFGAAQEERGTLLAEDGMDNKLGHWEQTGTIQRTGEYLRE